MATITRTPANRRAEALRDAWQRAGGYAAQAWGRALPPRARAAPAQAFRRTLAFMAAYPPLVQGTYYLLVGVGSYLFGGGPAAFAVLLLVVGGTLCLAAYRRQRSAEVLLLGLGSALGLGAVSLHQFLRGTSVLYLLDALLELGILALWSYEWWQARRAAASAPPAAVPVSRVVRP